MKASNTLTLVVPNKTISYIENSARKTGPQLEQLSSSDGSSPVFYYYRI